MTIFITRDDLQARAGRPLYLAIAAAMATAIQKGTLAPGTRLPTHRDLADALGVTVGTISRAYLEAERRELIRGEVGRGTFVLPPAALAAPAASFARIPTPAAGPIDLRANLPPPPEGVDLAALFADTLQEMSRRPALAGLFGDAEPGESAAARNAGATWLARCGVTTHADRVLLTAGAQHGLIVVCASLANPGDVLLTEPLTNPGIKAAAALLHLRLEPVAADADGLLPEALAQACQTLRPRAVYLSPTSQNPTASSMPLARRQAIAAVAQQYGLALLEDDDYSAIITGGPPPLAALAPEQTYYVASLSKALGFGLRLGYVLAPPGMERRVLHAIRATTWMAPPLVTEVAAAWILGDAAERIVAGRRREAAARQALAREILAGHSFATHPQGYHLWLPLPAPWRSERFASAAERRGVAVASAEEFLVGQGPTPTAVRVALGAAHTRAAVAQGLRTLASLLAEGPELAML